MHPWMTWDGSCGTQVRMDESPVYGHHAKRGMNLLPLPLHKSSYMYGLTAGAGQWRGLLVRRLGSTAAAWYDEAALLPISQQDLRRQV